ncbi:hypothetical protein ACWEGE_12015 [Amycolatopsis sp. NPDC004747]
MTDLERKLAETLREQAGEVTPNLDAAWAEQQRRQRRPSRGRRAAVWIAPLAAVLVVLTSVLLATRLNTAQPLPPAGPGERLVIATPEHLRMSELRDPSVAVSVVDFVGQTNAWTAHAFFAKAGNVTQVCVAAIPRNLPFSIEAPQYGLKSPTCVRMGGSGRILAGYVGENLGPLPSGTALYVASGPSARTLKLYAANGDLSEARAIGMLGPDRMYLADVDPGSPPVRFEFS